MGGAVGLLLLFWTTACSPRADADAPSPPPELEGDRARQGTVEVDADPEMDVRSWQLIPANVTGEPFVPGVSPEGRELRMGAVAMAMGPDHPFSPDQAGVQFLFMGISDDWLYEDDASVLELNIDGEGPMEFEVMGYNESPGQGYVIETMSVPVPVDVILRLADAESAEGRLGPTSFSLDEQVLGHFQEFVEVLPPELLGQVSRR